MEVGIYAVTGAIAVASSAALALFAIGPSLSKKRSRWVEVKFGNPPSEGATFTRVVLEYETKDGWLTGRARKLAYVKRVRKDHVIAISADCSHLGCVVTWDEGQKMFNCPCHKGRFDVEGKVISGPPSAPLQRHKTRMDNGKLFLATEPVPNGEDASEGV